MTTAVPLPENPAFTFPEYPFTLDDVEHSLLDQALRLCDGNQSNAARLLGLTRYQLRYRCRRYGLELGFSVRRVRRVDDGIRSYISTGA